MTTLSHSTSTAPRSGSGTRRWSTDHPYAATTGLMLAAIVCGVLVGLLFNAVMSGAEPTAIHRGGGTAKAAVIHRVQSGQTAAARANAVLGGFTFSSERSPARGGFAVGRAAGDGDGATVSGAGSE